MVFVAALVVNARTEEGCTEGVLAVGVNLVLTILARWVPVPVVPAVAVAVAGCGPGCGPAVPRKACCQRACWSVQAKQSRAC